MTECKMQTKRTWDAAFGGDGAWIVVKMLDNESNRRKVFVERVVRVHY